MTEAKCCCCGFRERHGVFTSHSSADGLYKVFMCIRCFMDPNIFAVGKRWLPHWTLAVKTQGRRNPFGRYAPDEPEQKKGSVVVSAKKSRREVAMSESLYVGQRQLCCFAGESV